jgi:hypothetical protein
MKSRSQVHLLKKRAAIELLEKEIADKKDFLSRARLEPEDREKYDEEIEVLESDLKNLKYYFK